MKVISFDHIHFYSNKPEETASFYVRHFDGKEMFRNKEDRIFLSLGGQTIVIGPFPSNRTNTESSSSVEDENLHQHHLGLDHFGIRVKDLGAAIQKLREQGIQILAEPTRGSSGVSYAFIAGPDKVIIELTQYGLLQKLYITLKKLF